MKLAGLKRSDRDGDSLIVEGGHALHGSAFISGFKHALVTTLAAGLVCNGRLRLTNVPQIAETDALEGLLRWSGASVSRETNCLSLDSRGASKGHLPPDVAGKIHGSVYLAPGLLRHCGETAVQINGGCQIGNASDRSRPAEHYLEVLRAFGAVAQLDAAGQLHAHAECLRGCEIDLKAFAQPSCASGNLYSGATKMALLCAAAATGRSTLANLYQKSDVFELIDVLAKLGVLIYQGENGSVVIDGGGALPAREIQHELGPDLIEVVTWITAAGLYAAEPFTLRGLALKRVATGLRAEIELFATLGIIVRMEGDAIVVSRSRQELCALDIIVDHTASIFSDSHPFFALLAMHSVGQSRIVEKVWRDRFAYVDGLSALGGRLEVHEGTLVVQGPCQPNTSGRSLCGTDLRATAVLLLAALGVAGRTRLSGASHLRRGYADLPAALRTCGARIEMGPNAPLAAHAA